MVYQKQAIRNAEKHLSNGFGEINHNFATIRVCKVFHNHTFTP